MSGAGHGRWLRKLETRILPPDVDQSSGDLIALHTRKSRHVPLFVMIRTGSICKCNSIIFQKTSMKSRNRASWRSARGAIRICLSLSQFQLNIQTLQIKLCFMHGKSSIYHSSGVGRQYCQWGLLCFSFSIMILLGPFVGIRSFK
jgi:hypothetical protein